MKWLDKFKRTIIEDDIDAMISLLDIVPKFEDLAEQKEALYLIEEARVLIKEEKNKILSQMQKIQKTKKFLKQKDGVYSFDMSF